MVCYNLNNQLQGLRVNHLSWLFSGFFFLVLETICSDSNDDFLRVSEESLEY